jgi:uncharacterized damage-inducible protein DinB
VSLDREALRELFDYTTFTWASYSKAMRNVAAEDYARPMEGSGWPALRNALFHIASAWDRWICEFSGSGEVVDEAYRPETWEETDAYRQRMRARLRGIIEDTADGRLQAPWMPIVAGGEPEMTPADIIAHILLHERGHHGDVSTLLQSAGVTLPGIDYMTYVFFKKRKSSG